MSRRIKLLSALLCSSILMAGCSGGAGDNVNVGGGNGGDLSGGGSGNLGGGSGGNNGGGNTGDGGSGGDGGSDGGDGSAGTTNVTFNPLAVFEPFKSYSGFDSDGLFQGDASFPLIEEYSIAPLNATTLTAINTAQASDYRVTINDVEIDASESYPVLQKVLGAPVALRTALLFDISPSMDAADIAALVAEAKDYVAAAQASSNTAIANQEFIVWNFAKDIKPLTNDGSPVPKGVATKNPTVINAALDQVLVDYNARKLGFSSNLHKAIVQVVGRFSGAQRSIAFGADGDNDLFDSVTDSQVNLSQLVLFSAGNDTASEFEQTEMVDAIKSQGFQVISEGDEGGTARINKPLIYYVVGGTSQADAYDALSAEAENTTYLTLDANTEYSFADDLVSKQIAAMNRRVDANSHYLYRYAFLPRASEQTVVFSSISAGANQSLTSKYTAEFFDEISGDGVTRYKDIGTPAQELSSLIEITGPEGEFLSNGVASFEQVQRFGFATRWINHNYEAADYSWELVNPAGGDAGQRNSDGTFTITQKTSATLTLRLTNNTLATKNIAQITIVD